MADRLCECCIGCCSKICAVFCRDMSAKCSYIIQFTVYFILQGYNVASDIGMLIDVFSAIQRCNELSDSPINQTQSSQVTSRRIYCRQPGNFTLSDLDKHILTLEILQWFFLIFAMIGTSLYIAHLCVLLPNLCKHCRDPAFEHELDGPYTPRYYRNIVRTHAFFMILETFIHDIPASCLAVELSLHYFVPAQINCWECVVSATSIPAEVSLQRSSLWIGLKISAVALITIYKGILPLYFWIGNPFCWSCYPLRLFITLPAGLGFLVLVLTPCMGIAKYRVMVEAPDLESALSNASDIIFTIGVVFWGIIIVGFLMWKIFNKFVMELCPCLEWCSEEDDKKKKREDEKNTGCWCF
ncbi:uncharacterized protein [Montipora capricornis]|uniref:uncharacterized protein n=1 Tax=Montipora capricornis TaxID=246305 RepID=UPI0035F1F8A1